MPPPGPKRNALLTRLRPILGMKQSRMRREIRDQQKLLPYANITLKQDVRRPCATTCWSARNASRA